jgi:hypothetical protein
VVCDAAKGRDARKDGVGLYINASIDSCRAAFVSRSFRYLSSTISRQSVIPQTLVRPSNGLLFVVMARVSENNVSKTEH